MLPHFYYTVESPFLQSADYKTIVFFRNFLLGNFAKTPPFPYGMVAGRAILSPYFRFVSVTKRQLVLDSSSARVRTSSRVESREASSPVIPTSWMKSRRP